MSLGCYMNKCANLKMAYGLYLCNLCVGMCKTIYFQNVQVGCLNFNTFNTLINIKYHILFIEFPFNSLTHKHF